MPDTRRSARAELRMEQADRTDFDPELFRRVMGSFASGVTVITSREGDRVRGMTANAFMSGSLAPPLCVVSVAKRAHMHAVLLDARWFGVSILADGQERFSDHFAGNPDPDLQVLFEEIGPVSVLAGVCSQLANEIVARHDCGDHTIFIGRILQMVAFDRPPLVYHAGRYGGFVHRIGDPEVTAPEFW